MLKILSLLINPLKTYFTNRQKNKAIKLDQQHRIIEAKTKSTIKLIETDQINDHSLDYINQQNKRFTYKDEFITYLFLIPVLTANLVPFFIAFSHLGTFKNLNQYTLDSYNTLDLLPDWYKFICFMIVIDVLGFRSFVRSFLKKIKNYLNN